MLFRFSFYGFLKNQRYFEPFLILVFLEKGLSFFQIGLLIAFREVAVNLLEIPSGAVADVCGRRRAMILSFTAYIASFLVFGMAQHLPLLFVAMLFFAVGEAFRTGTHKAMIFTWLRLQDRADERTKVYGYTRSWSKYGSALSVVLASATCTLEEMYVLKKLAAACSGASLYVVRHVPDGVEDNLLRRSDRHPNVKGAELLGIPVVDMREGAEGEGIQEAVPDNAVLFAVGFDYGVGAPLENFFQKFARLAVVAARASSLTRMAHALIPGLTFAEKDGLIVNFEGHIQQLSPHREECRYNAWIAEKNRPRFA